MENLESKSSDAHEMENQKLQENFNRLQSIAEILREMGLQVIDNFITIERLQNPTSEMGFPIVRDGVDGIRASYSKRRGLIIWFTNGFEDPNDPKRQKIIKRLQEEGLM